MPDQPQKSWAKFWDSVRGCFLFYSEYVQIYVQIPVYEVEIGSIWKRPSKLESSWRKEYKDKCHEDTRNSETEKVLNLPSL